MFYPGDARELEASVAELLEHAATPTDETAPPPKALIVPHAGYVYSGPIAASAYARLRATRERVRRVVLLGPAHRVALRGLAAPRCEALATPLGRVPVDQAALAELRDLPQVGGSDRAHALEHSLEVQLPFLQLVLERFAVVPLVVGDATDAEVAEVIERLWGGDETLFVISSDLSHYYDYATARRMDAASCRAIETLAPEALGAESACGRVPVRGLLRAARRHGLEAHTLDLRSSGDTAGDRRRVVGYGAWALVPARTAGRAQHEGSAEDAAGSSSADAALRRLARHAIADGLERGEPQAPDLAALPRELSRPGACFVTLRGPDGELRGCIGSLEARRPIAVDVVQNAWAAASRDPRMRPVERAELPSLRIEISLLGTPEPLPVRSFEELVAALRPGRDGLVLEDGEASGTLLPQVWEQLPERRDFASAVWRKAGLPARHWSPTARAHRYEVRKLSPA